MTVAVSNTTPLCYLIQIGCVQILPFLYEEVYIPVAVFQELTHEDTPEVVRHFIHHPPSWLQILEISEHPPFPHVFSSIDPGEVEAILLAEEIHSDIILLDDKDARNVARVRGLNYSGTLGILKKGAIKGEVNLEQSINRLKQTNFRIHPSLLRWVFEGIS